MVIMQCSAHPLIQIVGAPGFLQTTGREKKKKDLPDDQAERVNITLLPNPNAESLKKEPKSSLTKLLAGIVYYYYPEKLWWWLYADTCSDKIWAKTKNCHTVHNGKEIPQWYRQKGGHQMKSS